MSIKIKTQSEINLMRESGHILANVFKEVGKIVQAGISTKELDKFVYNYIRKITLNLRLKVMAIRLFPLQFALQ